MLTEQPDLFRNKTPRQGTEYPTIRNIHTVDRGKHPLCWSFRDLERFTRDPPVSMGVRSSCRDLRGVRPSGIGEKPGDFMEMDRDHIVIRLLKGYFFSSLVRIKIDIDRDMYWFTKRKVLSHEFYSDIELLLEFHPRCPTSHRWLGKKSRPFRLG